MQLKRLITSCGVPDVHVYKDTEGHLNAADRNRTWQKISTDLPKFVNEYTGTDLAEVVRKKAEELYIQVLKKSANKLEKLNVKLSQQNLSAIQTGTLKLKIVRVPRGAV